MNNLNESQMLTKELDGLEDVKKIEQLIEDAETMGGLDNIVVLAREKINKLTQQVEEAAAETTISGNELTTEEKIEDKNTEDLYTKEIDKVMTESVEEIKEIEGAPENNVEKNSPEAEVLKKIEENGTLEKFEADEDIQSILSEGNLL